MITELMFPGFTRQFDVAGTSDSERFTHEPRNQNLKIQDYWEWIFPNNQEEIERPKTRQCFLD